MPLDWHSGMVFSIFLKKTTTESVFQFQVKHTPPGKVTARLWIVESSLCPIAEPGLQEEH